MTIPERLRNKTVGQLRELARADAREFLTQQERYDYPFDMVHLARDAGAEVMISQLGDDVFGMIEGHADGATIYVDSDQPLNRRRFTLAHELGHMVSYKDEAGTPNYVDARSDAGSGTASEIYANEFAGAVLMPETLMKQFIDDGMNNWDIARELKVSTAAVSYRRQLLGI
ncbi:ImmA/IrrE family metallo-endopeptidase [Yaniella flava]|uniref:ImmA/IrrE family metallo-endopeptidase n=1 Tax=Yaniella flava TaxID=287930 RepID=UPI0031D01098